MTIRPVSKCQNNFNEIAELCHSEQEPVFIRAQDYTRSIARPDLYDKLAPALRQIDSGVPSVTHDELFRELRERLNTRG